MSNNGSNTKSRECESIDLRSSVEIEMFDPEAPAETLTTNNAATNIMLADSKNGSKPKLIFSDHSLRSTRRGDSECEQLAHSIEKRRANRMPVTFEVRVKFLKACRSICLEKGYSCKSKILLSDLVELRDEVAEKINQESQREFRVCKPFSAIFKLAGFHEVDDTLLQVLNNAIEHSRQDHLKQNEWFSFRDYSFYYTRVESKWPWMRNNLTAAYVIIFFYYFFTPIFFCNILEDKGVCEEDPTDKNRWYYGWVSSLYFASTTMSTVGYGDLSVEKESSSRVFIGIVYMMVSIIMAITAFNAAAGAASSPLSKYREKLLELIPWYHHQKARKDLLLFERIRLLKFVRLTEIALYFSVLNMIGFLASRFFTGNSPEEEWTWMESMYWAVQTTTTIGYGDLTIPFEMRWFNIVYLALSTYMVGSVLGKLASLKEELEETRRYYAWERRDVSAGMVEEFQAEGHDDVVDQYEFALASLLTLGKVTSSDITPIMDKFRDLAGEKGFIFAAEDMGDTDDESSSDDSNVDVEAEANAQVEAEQVISS